MKKILIIEINSIYYLLFYFINKRDNAPNLYR